MTLGLICGGNLEGDPVFYPHGGPIPGPDGWEIGEPSTTDWFLKDELDLDTFTFRLGGPGEDGWADYEISCLAKLELCDPYGGLCADDPACDWYEGNPPAEEWTPTIYRTFEIEESVYFGPVVITTESLPAGAVGDSYSASVSAVGGSPPYEWSGISLPSGLTIDSQTGEIEGTPRSPDTASFLVMAVDEEPDTVFTYLQISISPGTPDSLEVSFQGLGLAPQISWTALSGGAAYYAVERRVNGSAWEDDPPTGTTSSTSFWDYDVLVSQPDTNNHYEYRVKAVYGDLESGYSNVVEVWGTSFGN